MNTASRFFAISLIAAALLGSTGCFFRVEHHRDPVRVEHRVNVDVDVREHRDDGSRTVERHEENREERHEERR